MTTLLVTPSRKYGYTPIGINVVSAGNNMYLITIKAPDGSIEYIPPYGGRFDPNYTLTITNEDSAGYLTTYYYRDNWPLGKYTVTVDVDGAYPPSDTKTFNVITQAEYENPYLTYPNEILQNQTFSWSLENINPGDSLYIRSEGPNGIINYGPFIAEVTYYDDGTASGHVNFDNGKYEYAGTYVNTFTMSGTGKHVTNTVVVKQKIFINCPETVTANKSFSYDISGGNKNESWSAQIVGPISWTINGSLNENGTSSYNDVLFTSSGYYEITWIFPNSGKFKKNVHVISDGRPGPDSDGIHPEGIPLSFSEIDAEFSLGGGLNPYRGDQWFLKNGDYGNFDSNGLNFYEFYRKKSVDPAVPGSVYYSEPGNYSFVIPLHRHEVTIEAWGGGGGSGSSIIAGTTDVYFPGNHMSAGGGESSGGGGRRYFSPGGRGGIASGAQTNINGNSGGNDMGAYTKGGTGANSPYGGNGGAGGIQHGVGNFNGDNGQSPGGGGGGRTGMDGSKYPGYGGAGGGGSGAYCATTAAISTGTQIDFSVGQGAQDWASSGGNGAVKISWY